MLPRMTQPDGALKKFYKAIRSHEETVSWYSSKSSLALDQPPVSLTCYGGTLQSGDLFINIHSNGIQSWIRELDRWVSVEEDHPHPFLKSYRLILLKNGDPSWVTRKTVVTYRAKMRNVPT